VSKHRASKIYKKAKLFALAFCMLWQQVLKSSIMRLIIIINTHKVWRNFHAAREFHRVESCGGTKLSLVSCFVRLFCVLNCSSIKSDDNDVDSKSLKSRQVQLFLLNSFQLVGKAQVAKHRNYSKILNFCELLSFVLLSVTHSSALIYENLCFTSQDN